MERQIEDRQTKIEKDGGKKARREPGKEAGEEAKMGETQSETEGDRAIILTNSLRALLKGG